MTQCIQVVFQNTYGSGVSRISARGVLKVRPHTKSGGGGQSTSGPIYEKWGGGAIRFRSDTFVWHTENGYNFDQGGRGTQALHTRARMNVFNCIHS